VRGSGSRALEAFLVNTRTFPRSANTYDSLAEAYLGMADTTRAIQLYERALVVDPDFDNAKRMLDRIRGSAPR
jgi:tetratricopeptide (TPR) repeat protein